MKNLAQASEIIYGLELRVQELEAENEALKAAKKINIIKVLITVSIMLTLTVSMAIGYLIYQEIRMFSMDNITVTEAPNGK